MCSIFWGVFEFMAIKGGRRIIVRAREFQWVLSGNPNRNWEGAPNTPRVIVQGDAGKLTANLKSRRFISPEAHDLDMGGVRHEASVIPNDIRVLIEMALDDGWDPDSQKSYTSKAGIHLSDYTTT